MKNLLSAIVFLGIALPALAKPVTEATANKTGLNFLMSNTRNAFITSHALKLAYTSKSNSSGSNTIYYYVFNADHGFVIVAGDDEAMPILGYSDEGTFSPGNIPGKVGGWLGGYTNQMKYIISNNLPATSEITANWTTLINNVSPAAPQQASSGGTPLITTNWDQLPYYNDGCPYDNTAKRHTVTGCVATAMAQVMKFWAWPAAGIGFHSYNDPTFGTQSASFGGTSYQWTNMPNSLSGANGAVATLMYQCGVGVNMTYSPSESDAYVLNSQSPIQNCAEYALKTYFGYDNSLHGILKADYTDDADWTTVIKAEIDAGRPVIYTGTGSGGGHCFVCDGYNGSNLHFNWGWGGLYNGYYAVNALNPGTGGAGAGSGSYNSNEAAIIGIKPSTALLSYNLGLNSAVTLSKTTVKYQNSFTITTSILNGTSGSHSFTGDYSAEIFDSTGNLIDSVIVSSSSTLATGQNTGTLTFSYPGKATLLPGTYNIEVFYRPKGGNWSIASNNSYTNQAQITIYWANTLELSTPITVTPASPLQSKSITVNLNVINNGSSTFNGSFYAYLYSLNGYPDFLIQKVSGSLNPGASFKNGLTFTNADDTVSPGTYFLVIYYSPTVGQYDLMGSTNYQNPIKITIAAPQLPPDQYEPDNTVDSAYIFTPTFTNYGPYIDSTEIKIEGNINTATDVDYYEINLGSSPFAYHNYTAKIYDLLHATNTQSYTLNGIFSYLRDSAAAETGAYNDSIPAVINEFGHNSIFFKVAPIFPGLTGTYLLDIKLSGYAAGGINQTSAFANEIKTYPNPATDVLNIDYGDMQEIVNRITITDLAGKQVFETNNPIGKSTAQIPVGNIPAGLYVLQLQTDKSLINKKISIIR